MGHFVKRHEKSSIWPKLATFRANYHVSPFWSSFQQKVAKSGSFRDKAGKINDLAKTSKFSRELRCFGQLFSKKLQKVAHFVKRHANSSIWPKLDSFRVNYHVSAFWSTFQAKVAKSGSFREKARKIIDLAKTCNFWIELPCFGVLVNFSAKSGPFRGPFREKARKLIDLAKTCNFPRKLPCFGVLVNC